MSGEKDLEQLKRDAAAKAKAKAEAIARKKKEGQVVEEEPEEDLDLAKKKAAAAAKAKAAALAKKKAQEAVSSDSLAKDDLAKQKAAAAAKAKAAALAKKKAKEQAGADDSSVGDDKAKAAAAAKAKAAAAAKAKAAAAAKAKSAGGGATTPEAEERPSKNQPLLDKYIRVIQEHLGKEVIEESYINRLSKDVPTLVIKREAYYKVAQFLKHNEQLGFDYLSELHGTDFKDYMEVYVYLYSFQNNQAIAIKVKLDHDQPEIDSIVPLWAGANWPECEAYDLLGITFTGHPNLYRIMLGEKWIGHPLRKDYEDQSELEV